MESYHILVVEDDPDINRLLCRVLTDGGYDCRPAYSGSEAELWVGQYQYDLVLLDLMLPGLTGEEFISRLRQRGQNMPVIVLSAKTGVEDRVNVLKLGADDFIPKPFDNHEVLARVEAQLRRANRFSAPAGAERVLHWKDLTLDRDGATVTAGDQGVPLTAREFELLRELLSSPGRVFTREILLAKLWGYDFFGDERVVDSHIKNLRHKLGRDYIETVRGVGYRAAKETR